ncbi:hypothetical protein PENNAL_c0794G03227, partial [Penicillium nalgiovense]
RRIRVIAPERPGFGLSTVQPNRRIMDWPADVQALAHYLSLSRFAVMGGSGGGPYALACARMLPQDMMSAVGIFAGITRLSGNRQTTVAKYSCVLRLPVTPLGLLGLDLNYWTAPRVSPRQKREYHVA